MALDGVGGDGEGVDVVEEKGEVDVWQSNVRWIYFGKLALHE